MTNEKKIRARKMQLARNKKNVRAKEIKGYKRYSRMVPARAFDAMDAFLRKESKKWENDCGRSE